MAQMRAVVCRPDEPAEAVFLNDWQDILEMTHGVLDSMMAVPGVMLFRQDSPHERAKLKPNRTLMRTTAEMGIADTIFGTFAFVGVTEKGSFRSLTVQEAEHLVGICNKNEDRVIWWPIKSRTGEKK